MARRGGMEGSITERNGGYQARVDGAVNPRTGTRRQLSRQCKTRKEAQAWIAEQIHIREHGSRLEPSALTLRDYLEEWLRIGEGRGLAPSTRQYHASICRSDILPALGAVKLQRIGPLHITRLHTELRARGLSPTTVHHADKVLRQALAAAVAMKLLREHPCADVDAPRRARREMQVWDKDQVRAFLMAIEGTDLAVFWHLALATGMRRGELLGLRWGDCDLERGTVTVRQSTTFAHGGRHTGNPKTASGIRRLATPAEVVARLRAHRIRQLNEKMERRPAWVETDLVIGGMTGEGIWPQTLRRAMAAGIAAAGIPRIRLHDLRHTYATHMLLAGRPVHVVARALGHANPAITLRTYAHVLDASERDLADTASAVLYG